MPLSTAKVRKHFPALASNVVYFDNPGGTQVPQQTIDRMQRYLVEANANSGAAFQTSVATDAVVLQARQAMAGFLNAPSSKEIVFGPNMTSLTFNLSRALASELNQGDEIIVTRLDHDANISPWLLIARDRGCTIRWLDFNPQNCTLKIRQFENLLNERTRLLAVGYASNAVGTINPVRGMVALAHQAGALTYIDAVHYAPHAPIDVQDLDCDFLVASAYKFFGPHLGVLYGKREHLDRLEAYKVRPAPHESPEKFETGTLNFESLAGLLGTMSYLEELGERYGAEQDERYVAEFSAQALSFKKAMAAIRAYEMELSRRLLETLSAIPGLRLYGLTDPASMDLRVPTASFTIEGHHPRSIAQALAQENIHAWDGNFYALAVTERLGLEQSGGLVRIGLVHYNTFEEIERLGEALHKLAD